ncbi:MAG: glutaredoxin family protein [Gallionellaceae bacterium]|jgi:hypothetical protein|nr:glutaredoxin family protein [Gallionellaceae bacterium]
MKRFVLLVCLASMSWIAQAGELYRWVDASGKVHYGKAPPPGATRIEIKKFSDIPPPAEYLPYETRLAQQNFPVVLYVADGCGEPCDLARNLLIKRGIPFGEKLLRTKQEIDEFKSLSGLDSAPVLAVGKTFLNGFLAEQWHDELSIAGYPKNAPYVQPVAPGAASQVEPTNPAVR